MTNPIVKEFLNSLKEVEAILEAMGFHLQEFLDTPAYFITFKRDSTSVKFIFGPIGWETEMIIFTAKGKFGLWELLQIPAFSEWFYANRYERRGPANIRGRNIRDEMLYNIEELKVALPIIE
jgi:hypothetical protein